MKYNSEIHHRRSIRLKGYDYSQAGAYFITICCENKLNRFGEITVGITQNNDMRNGQSIMGQPQGIAPTNVKTQYNNVHQYIEPIMQLNEYGQIAYNEWLKLSERFNNFELDVFQIMPNHMHGIIVLNDVGAGLAPALLTPAKNIAIIKNHDVQKEQPQGIAPTNHQTKYNFTPTISDIVGSYKSLVANGCLDIYKTKNEIMGKFWQRNYYEHIIRNEQSYQDISEYIINNPSKWQEDEFYTAKIEK